jgi:hypothetical protein
MKQTFPIYLCWVSLSTMLVFGSVSAEENSSRESLCTKEVLMTFFPKPLIKNVLIQYKISDQEAEKIAQELSTKDQEVVRRVEKKASAMDPNPLKELNEKDAALKLFRETLFEVFAEVLNAHGVEDSDKVRLMLDDMQAAKGKLFVECIRRDRAKAESTP